MAGGAFGKAQDYTCAGRAAWWTQTANASRGALPKDTGKMELLVPIIHGVEQMSVHDPTATRIKGIATLDLANDPDISGDIFFSAQIEESL